MERAFWSDMIFLVALECLNEEWTGKETKYDSSEDEDKLKARKKRKEKKKKALKGDTGEPIPTRVEL